MKNYNKNLSYNTSKEYYLNVLKQDNKNLNLSKNKLDIFDLYLEKILNISYKIFAPIFKEDDAVLKTNNYQHNDIDVAFDEQLAKSLPHWVNQILHLFKIIYHKFFVKKTIQFCTKIITKIWLTTILLLKETAKVIQNKFFIINSSP